MEESESSKIPPLLDHVVTFRRQKSMPMSGSAQDSSLTPPSHSSSSSSSCSTAGSIPTAEGSIPTAGSDPTAESIPTILMDWDHFDNDSIHREGENWTGEPTPLYMSIESEDWMSLHAFLTADSWDVTNCCRGFLCDTLYDAKSRGGASAQVRTWIRIPKETMHMHDEQHYDEIYRLPLHAALQHKAPHEVIQKLVQLYADSVKFPDSTGNFPLHLAFQNDAKMSTLVLLLKEYPGAVNKKNYAGYLPDECGKGNEVGDVLRICMEEIRAYIERKVKRENAHTPVKKSEKNLLIDVSKELTQLHECVSEVTGTEKIKEKIILSRNQLAKAASDLTGLMADLQDLEEGISLRNEVKGIFHDSSTAAAAAAATTTTNEREEEVKGIFEDSSSAAVVNERKEVKEKKNSKSFKIKKFCSFGSMLKKTKNAKRKPKKNKNKIGESGDYNAKSDNKSHSTAAGSTLSTPPRSEDDTICFSPTTDRDEALTEKEADVSKSSESVVSVPFTTNDAENVVIEVKEVINSKDGIELMVDLDEHERMLLRKSLEDERRKTEKIRSELERIKRELDSVKEKDRTRKTKTAIGRITTGLSQMKNRANSGRQQRRKEEKPICAR